MIFSSLLLVISSILMLLGFGLFVYHIYFGKLFFKKNEPKTSESAGAFGEFIGGITGPVFALAGFLIVYSTIIENRQNNNDHKVESIFFKLLDYQRDNLESINIAHPIECNDLSGNSTWVPLRGNMCSVKFFLDTSIYSKNLLTEQDKEKIFYIMFFYGTPFSSSSLESKSLPFLKKYIRDSVALDSILQQCKRLNHCDKITRRFIGYSNKLTPVFNQFLNCIQYVDKSNDINDEMKKYYVKILIDQHSPFCMSLMYFHFSSEIEKPEKMQLLRKYDVFGGLDQKFLVVR